MIKLIHITTVGETLGFFSGQIGFLKEQGFDVHVASSPGKDATRFAHAESVEFHSVPMSREISPLTDLVSLFRLCLLFARIRPDIVHSHTPKAGMLSMIAAFLTRVPVRIYHNHGLRYLTTTGVKRSLLIFTERFSCRLSHRVLCVSPSVRQVMIEKGICTDEKSKCLGRGGINGVDALNKFNPEYVDKDAARSAIGIPADARVIGFVGRVVCDKGVIELLSAWELLRRRFEDIYLLVVGSMEEMDEIPLELKNRLQTDSRIIYVGGVLSIVNYYAAMDILTLPSYREGFSMVTMEAAAMSLPVVATRIPGNVDSVIDGETGLLVPPKNADALEQALIVYLENKDLRILHGRNGRRRALKDFRPQDMWKTLHAEYLEMIKIKIDLPRKR